MEENANNVTNASAVNVQNETPVKKFRVGFIFLSLVPVVVLTAIQTAAQIPFLILASVEVINDSEITSDAFNVYDHILDVFNAKYAFYSYLIYAVVGLAVFAIWYYKGFVKKNPKVKISDVFGVKSVTGAVILAIALYFSIEAAMVLVKWVLPSVIESYNEMIEMTGIATEPILTIVYGIILGPILEELCFRGLVFAILEKSNARPWLCILISSIMFGAIHLIPVQVAYATVLALFLGFLRYKYRSVMITVAAHMLFNLFGTYISEAVKSLGLGDGFTVLFGGISLILIVIAIVIIQKDKKALHS